MPFEDSKSYQYLFLCPTFNSKESPPTLASKVDQLEGLLKMLQEDLRKVNISSTEICKTYIVLIGDASNV